MTFHTQNDRARHEQCTSLGRDIDELKPERADLINQITNATRQIQAKEPRLANIEQELQDIRLEEMTSFIPTGIVRRTVRDAISTAVSGTRAISLDQRRKELEREHDRLQSELSGHKAELEQAKGRLDDVEYLLRRLRQDFTQLGCGLAYFTPSN